MSKKTPTPLGTFQRPFYSTKIKNLHRIRFNVFCGKKSVEVVNPMTATTWGLDLGYKC